MNLKNTLKRITFVVLLSMLMGCQDWSWLSAPAPHILPKNQLRLGLFGQKDAGPLHMRQERQSHQEPNVIWSKMRLKFHLDYPENHPRVKQYIQEYTKTNYHLNQLSKNAAPFIHMIVEEVDKRGLPHEFALLPMVESNFNPLAVSHTGAQGLWQIMPATGKVLGLKQDFWYDGRKDIKASTVGALNHLQYLHRLFDGDWLLALAAYNAGERRVIKAIEENKKKKKPIDFWHLNLPKETQNYVPKLLALCAIVKHPKKYDVTLPAIANEPYAKIVQIHHQIDLQVAASLAEVDIDELRHLNPALHHDATHPKGPHQILLPSHCAGHFMKQIRRMPPETLTSHSVYVVQAGDNLHSIAQKFETSVHSLKVTNDLQGKTLHPGTTLFIPSKAILAKDPQVIHVVRKGDSLWSISKKYQVQTKDIVAWNQLGQKTLQPGQELIIKQA